MVQKQVAQRIAPQPGTPDYSAFTVFCQYYAEPELLFDVPAHCFLPQPKVTSAVITLRTRQKRPWEIADEAVFFRAVRASFAVRTVLAVRSFRNTQAEAEHFRSVVP